MFHSVSLGESSPPLPHPAGTWDAPRTWTNAFKCNSKMHFLRRIPCPLTHAFLFPWLIYSVILVPAARQSLNHFTLKLILCPPTTGQHYAQLMCRLLRGAGKLRIMFFSFLFRVCMCGPDREFMQVNNCMSTYNMGEILLSSFSCVSVCIYVPGSILGQLSLF